MLKGNELLLQSTVEWFLINNDSAILRLGRNIALLRWEINEADFLWNWNYFSSLIQIYELCFQHNLFNNKNVLKFK